VQVFLRVNGAGFDGKGDLYEFVMSYASSLGLRGASNSGLARLFPPSKMEREPGSTPFHHDPFQPGNSFRPHSRGNTSFTDSNSETRAYSAISANSPTSYLPISSTDAARPEVLEQHRDHCGRIFIEYATSLLRHAAQGEGQWTDEALERPPRNE
jgi:hypothetical protein